jgi:hypothetical protein
MATRAEAQAKLITAYGIQNADAIVRAHDRPGRPKLARGLAMVENETGGRNEFGDEGLACPVEFCEQLVTQSRYAIYKAEREDLFARGIVIGVCNGVGLTQITDRALQQAADALGGCWIPQYNADVGFATLHQLIAELGVREGFRAYNGSGPAAEEYADRADERAWIWEGRLARL